MRMFSYVIGNMYRIVTYTTRKTCVLQCIPVFNLRFAMTFADRSFSAWSVFLSTFATAAVAFVFFFKIFTTEISLYSPIVASIALTSL